MDSLLGCERGSQVGEAKAGDGSCVKSVAIDGNRQVAEFRSLDSASLGFGAGFAVGVVHCVVVDAPGEKS